MKIFTMNGVWRNILPVFQWLYRLSTSRMCKESSPRYCGTSKPCWIWKYRGRRQDSAAEFTWRGYKWLQKRSALKEHHPLFFRWWQITCWRPFLSVMKWKSLLLMMPTENVGKRLHNLYMMPWTATWSCTKRGGTRNQTTFDAFSYHHSKAYSIWWKSWW